ncbi:MAG: aspartate--tRNA(Asn) ligase [Candidatus Bathyarchaeota archaeon]
MDKLGNWRRTHSSKEVTPNLDGQVVTVFGWVQGIRDLGRIKFIILGDKDGDIQITVPMKTVSSEVVQKVLEIKKQYVIGVQGIVKKSGKAPRGVEINPHAIRILNSAQHPLALDPTGRTPADIDVRLNARILDLRRPESQAIFRINRFATNSIREFLLNKGYLEVNTPRLIASATEGGAALFPVVYFDKEAFLAQSSQLYKEELTAVFEKVFEIGSFFRAEESHTTRHISEFVSVDVEMAFSTRDDTMKVLEELTEYVVKFIRKNCDEELKTLKHEIEVPKLPLKRYTYDEILSELKEQNIAIPWGEDIPTPALRAVGKIHSKEFYFIIDWPTSSKPFYIKPRDDSPEICEGFDFMHSWIELASGGTRIHDKELLTSRMREQNLKPETFVYHLKAFEVGMPPHAGWGLGFNRFVMVLTGKDNIRECVLFPRDRYRLTP